MIDAVMRAPGMGLAMGWEILWPLILGFALAGYPPDCPGRHCGHCADADRLGDGGGWHRAGQYHQPQTGRLKTGWRHRRSLANAGDRHPRARRRRCFAKPAPPLTTDHDWSATNG